MSKVIVLFIGMVLSSLSCAQNYIPGKAYVYRSIVIKEVDTFFPDIPNRSYVPALIEHESCITLKHSRCWSATSRLKTSREEGAGLGQLTRAYNKDGTERFDALSDLRTRHRRHLAELSWETIYQRPDLQIRSLILMTKDNFKSLYDVANLMERLAMSDAGYNGGMGGLQRERRQCNLTRGCDPGVWFGNVELHCLKSKKPLYANRSACDINRHHVKDVLKYRIPKYEKLDFMS